MALKHLPIYRGDMESPCVKKCDYDPVSDLCRGCGRTLEEIADWTVMDQKARARVLSQLPERLKRLAAS